MAEKGCAGFLSDALAQRMAAASLGPVAITAWPDGRIIFANTAFCRLAGRDAAAVASAALAEIVPGFDPALLQQAAESGQAAACLAWSHGADTTWWDWRSVPVQADGGGTVIVTTAHEVTEHVNRCRAAEQARATLDALLAHIPEGITIARGPGVHVEQVSDYGRALTRRPKEDLVGVDVQAHPEAWQVYEPGSETPLQPELRPLARAINQGEVTENRTLLLRRPDGGMVPVLCSSGPIRDADGQITGAIMAWRDITELHEAREQERLSTDRLQLALQAGKLGIWETDYGRRRTSWDPRLAEMLGLATDRWTADIGEMMALIHPDDRDGAQASFEQAIQTLLPFANEFRIVTAAGETRWLSTQGIFVGDRAIGVARDITERKVREDRLEQAVQDRDLLMREADHRIKNSLQLIASLLTLQQRRLSDPEARAALSDAIARVQAVGEAHRSLYQSRDFKTVDFGQTLADICAHLGRLTPSVEMECQAEDGLQLDAERAIPLGLAISELLTNAAKHAYPGSQGKVSVSAFASADELAVRVADEGAGLPDRKRDDNRLGTSIVRRLAEQIGASVETDSTPGKGTRVTIRLPRSPG